MEICNPSHFIETDNFTKDYFYNLKLSDYFCVPSYLKNLTAQGAFDQSFYQAIKVSFHICDNTTYFNQCKPIEVIKNKIQRGFMGKNHRKITFEINLL